MLKGEENNLPPSIMSEPTPPRPASPPATGESFPRFLDLPAELQWAIWTIFCPELTSDHPHALTFVLHTDTHQIDKSPLLGAESAASRTVLSVHRELRELAVRHLPDTLAFGGAGHYVRCRGKATAVVLDMLAPAQLPDRWLAHYPGFSESVVTVCLLNKRSRRRLRIPDRRTFPNLKEIWDL